MSDLYGAYGYEDPSESSTSSTSSEEFDYFQQTEIGEEIDREGIKFIEEHLMHQALSGYGVGRFMNKILAENFDEIDVKEMRLNILDTINIFSEVEREHQSTIQKFIEKYDDPENITQKGKYLDYHWSRRFQRFQENLARDDLVSLVNDFTATTENYARIIIMEKNLPFYKKTIKPSSVGGIAGGEKFITNGILFKFARDVKIQGGWLYGGNKQNDSLAAKGLNLELKSLKAFFKCIRKKEIPIQIPLMCIVQYLGVSLAAVSLLPISNDTLCYGTADAGYNIYTSENDPTMLGYIKTIGEYFNFSMHPVEQKVQKKKKDDDDYVPVQGNTYNLWFAADVEIHKSDDAYYALDFGRFFPPNNSSHPYVEKFREEFLLNERKFKYNPDAFSGFRSWRDSPELSQKLDDEMEDAIDHLHFIINVGFWKDVRSGNITFTKNNIKQVVQMSGINMKYLGDLRKSCQADDETLKFKRYILEEMICRTIKSLVRESLNESLNEHCVPIEDIYRENIRAWFKKMKDEENFWSSSTELKRDIQKKYPESLNDEEMSDQVNLFDLIEENEKGVVLQRIAMYSNFQIGLTKSDTKILLKTKSIADNIVSEGSISELFDSAYVNSVTEDELWKHQDTLYEMNDPKIIYQFLFLFFNLSRNKERINYCLKYLIEKYDTIKEGKNWNVETTVSLLRALWQNATNEINYDYIGYVSSLFIKIWRNDEDLKRKLLSLCMLNSNDIEYIHNSWMPLSRSRENRLIISILKCIGTDTIFLTDLFDPKILPTLENLYCKFSHTVNSLILCSKTLLDKTNTLFQGLALNKLVISYNCLSFLQDESIELHNLEYLEVRSPRTKSTPAELGIYAIEDQKNFKFDLSRTPNLKTLIVKKMNLSKLSLNSLPPSLEVIELYNLQKYLYNILHSISSFTYLREVVVHFDLDFDELKDIHKGFDELFLNTSLEKLDITCLAVFKDGDMNFNLDIGGISQLTKLKYLNLDNIPLKNLEFISELRKLEHMSITADPFGNSNTVQKRLLKAPLKHLKKLESLSLANSLKIEKGFFHNLYKNFPYLETVDLSGTEYNTGRLPPTLTSLNISRTCITENFFTEALAMLVRLEYLDVTGVPRVAIKNPHVYNELYRLDDFRIDTLPYQDPDYLADFLNTSEPDLLQLGVKRTFYKGLPEKYQIEEFDQGMVMRIKLRHPNIARLFYGCVMNDEDFPYQTKGIILFEQNSTTTLSDLLSSGVPLEPHKYRIFIGVILGLNYIYATGNTYGMLSPDNIYVNISETGIVNVTLGNFGIELLIERYCQNVKKHGELPPLQRDYHNLKILAKMLFSDYKVFFPEDGSQDINLLNIAETAFNHYLSLINGHQDARIFWFKEFQFFFEIDIHSLFERLAAHNNKHHLPNSSEQIDNNIIEPLFETYFDKPVISIEAFSSFINRMGPISAKAGGLISRIYKLSEKDWFWRDEDADNISRMLQQHGHGYAAVRYSSKENFEFPFTLTYYGKDTLVNVRIKFSFRRKSYILCIPDNPKGNLLQLVDGFFESNGLVALPGSPYHNTELQPKSRYLVQFNYAGYTSPDTKHE